MGIRKQANGAKAKPVKIYFQVWERVGKPGQWVGEMRTSREDFATAEQAWEWVQANLEPDAPFQIREIHEVP